MQSGRLSRERGFTIVELLVVIGIIAVLAGILFPMFAKAKENGQKVSALSQLKQLGGATLIYLEGSDNYLVPSTNYGAPESATERLWTTVLKGLVKEEKLFVAPGSNGKFASGWDLRGWQTIGYNSSTAVDRQKGCKEDAGDQTNCLAFTSAARFDKQDNPSKIALLALTPGGEVKDKYLGYEFSPYNGTPNPENLALTPPPTSDRDLVKELSLPAELIKPIYARYLKTGSDDGFTPVVFGDGHVKDYSAKQINSTSAGIVWRLR